MIYIHIPYCHRKCSYCAFYSVASHRGRDEYVDALCHEIELRCKGMKPSTIYIGGGTPTQLNVSQLSRIADAISSCCDVSGVVESTIEANPEDLTPGFLSELRSIGLFNRLSIGVQSLVDEELKAVGRVHTVSQAIEAVEAALALGFSNISVDLIMGLPTHTVESWETTLSLFSKSMSEVKHLSCYELSVEPGSILKRQIEMGRVVLPSEEVVEKQYRMLMEWCAANGFEQYEVSNFCRKGFHSRHNSRYWNRTPYIGLGAGAHSFDGNCRRWNISDTARYIGGTMRGEVPYEEERLTDSDAFNEYVMTSLRTVGGIQKSMVKVEFRDHLESAIKPYIERGLIEETSTAYVPTSQAMLLADGIAADIFV